MEFLVGLIVLYVFYKMLKGLSRPGRSQRRSRSSGHRQQTVSLDYGRNYGRPRGKPAKWYPSGASATVRSHHLPDGLLYVGEVLLDLQGYANDACLINPKLQVSSAEPWEGGDEMGYWPRYDQIPARCRGAYLKWLAGGRNEPEAYIGYVFLFFYGLERRLMFDGSKGDIAESERLELVNEVRRLLSVYGRNQSFRGYAANFLAMEWALYRSDTPVPDYVDFTNRHCVEPFQLLLAQYVVAGKPITPDMALQWIALRPEFRLRTPARRCAEEFRELFHHRYARRFGNGFVVKPNKTPLRLQYRAASPSLCGDLQINAPNLPNPFILSGPLKRLIALAEECTGELESYSRYLGRKGNDPKSLAAKAALPQELLGQVHELEAARSCLASACSNGVGLVKIDALYEGLGEETPSQLRKKECENLAVFAEKMGYGVAPDVRYHGIKPTPDGEFAVFSQGHGAGFKPSKEFHMVGAILRLGALVSQIDEDVSPAEEAVLLSFIANDEQLSERERSSLGAFLYWCLRTPQNTAGLKPRLAGMTANAKTSISRILISVAHADGRIDPREVSQLEKLYVMLGLDKEQVVSDIHTLAASDDAVTVSLREPAADFEIPESREPTIQKGFRLDEELIRIREEETRQVKSVLQDIFSDQAEVETAIVSEIRETTDAPLAALDQPHRSLFERLCTQENWNRTALYEICRELGLMLDGAMETLNEWAFANANATLIEDGDPVYVDISLAEEIRNG